jgi:hypothetical protein
MIFALKQFSVTFLITLMMIPGALMVQPQQAQAETVQEWLGLAAGALGISTISCLGSEYIGNLIERATDWALDQLGNLVEGALRALGLDGIANAIFGGAGGAVAAVVGGAEVPVYDDDVEEAVETNTEEVTATVNSGFNTQEFRECVLDGLVWYFANVMIEQITADLVAWIDGGFEGTPAFVSDPEGFLYDVGNTAVGQMIWESEQGLDLLCEPFQLDIQLSLTAEFNRFQDDRQFQCTLGDVIDNLEGALAGDFNAGGWDGWFSLTQNPTNNPLGAGFAAREESYIEFRTAAGNRRMELDWGDGWHSLRDEVNGFMTMPGEFVQAKLDEQTNSFMDRLEVADDVNEIVQALVGFFVNEAVTGFGSLLQGDGDSVGGGDYLRDYAITGAPGQLVQGTLNRATQARQQAEFLGESSYFAELDSIIAELDAMDDDETVTIPEATRAEALAERVGEISTELNEIASLDGAPTTDEFPGLTDDPLPEPVPGTPSVSPDGSPIGGDSPTGGGADGDTGDGDTGGDDTTGGDTGDTGGDTGDDADGGGPSAPSTPTGDPTGLLP